MANVTEWHAHHPGFPLNAAGQYQLAATPSSLVYRLFHGGSLLGGALVEYDTNATTARYWDLPSALWPGPPSISDAIGMQIGPPRRPWLAMMYAGILARLDPGTGDFTGYTLGSGTGLAASLSFASRIRFDQAGNAWYTSNLALSTPARRPVIGRYRPGTGTTAMWELPFDDSIAMDVWPDVSRGAVWCSFAFVKTGKTRPALCVLRLSTGSMRCWFLTAHPSPTHSFSAMTGDRLRKPANMWLAYNDLASVRRVLRLRVATKSFTSFADRQSNPIDLDVDAAGNAWVANTDGRVQRLGARDTCRLTILKSTDYKAARFSFPVAIATYPSVPTSLHVSTNSYAVTPARLQCSTDFPLPAGTANPVLCGLTTATPRRRWPIFFSLPEKNGIGALTP